MMTSTEVISSSKYWTSITDNEMYASVTTPTDANKGLMALIGMICGISILLIGLPVIGFIMRKYNIAPCQKCNQPITGRDDIESEVDSLTSSETQEITTHLQPGANAMSTTAEGEDIVHDSATEAYSYIDNVPLLSNEAYGSSLQALGNISLYSNEAYSRAPHGIGRDDEICDEDGYVQV